MDVTRITLTKSEEEYIRTLECQAEITEFLMAIVKMESEHIWKLKAMEKVSSLPGTSRARQLQDSQMLAVTSSNTSEPEKKVLH